MSREELFDLIKSFGKNKGEYTEDEIVQIGKAHKT